ncbi:MAG: threonine--tRNA ligase [Candidatus Aenigmarchaeota archaeon]|nr:threonine--tRNA ligase [Candidatus Aenigmarchaeota archaeon]
MKILLVHSDFIEFYPVKKAIKSAEEIVQERQKIEECLVVFTSVEKNDEKDFEKIASNMASEVKKVALDVSTRNIVLYPYAHLSKDLSSPDIAIKIMQIVEEILKKDFSVVRAPFGWYKEFNIKCKGHPLSELSREIKADNEPEALKNEENLTSSFFILDTDGKMHKIEHDGKQIKGFDFSKHPKLEKLCKYELAKSRVVDIEPPHIKLMKKLELVDYEEGSDPGNLRYYPKGRLVKSLLEKFVTEKTIEYGGMEVETPLMYDYEHPSLKSYMNRFPARQYTIQTPNKRAFLRFAACFGQFLMTKDATISYRNLPYRIYELTRYSFRVEQRGELAGLRRLRAFTMPDCHCLVKDIEMAKSEMLRRFELSKRVQEGFGLTIENDMEFAIRIVKDFYDKNKEFVHSLVEKWGKPALIELWDQRFFYFILKYEFNFIDALDKAATLTTDQIDVENAERYGIQYMDSDNKKKYPMILHLSPSGAIERVLYSILEKAYMEQKAGKNPILPMWLSPTQIRLCPINDSLIPYAEEIMKKLEENNIRVDIDDRAESIGKKVRDAETEWIPISVVLGEKEKSSGIFGTRIRIDGKIHQMTLEEMIAMVKKQISEFPFVKLSLPKLLTKRPIFVG